MSAFLLNEAGDPVVPPSVAARLAQIDERLGCVWHRALRAFAFTLRWPQGDERWAMVQSGELPEDAAFQIIGYMPADAGIDDVASFAESQIVAAGQKLPDVAAVLAATARANAQVVEKAAEKVVEGVLASSGTSKKNKGVVVAA